MPQIDLVTAAGPRACARRVLRIGLALGVVLALGGCERASTDPLRASGVAFEGLMGPALVEAVAAAYAPAATLTQAQGKDTLYAVIERTARGGVEGVVGLYTDTLVAFDCRPRCDPSQDVYDGGSGLSQEHVWPRSRGAGAGHFERDLHHLFPALRAVNEARGNRPFGESPDAATRVWYGGGRARRTPPGSGRDAWSELGRVFEPREAVKGDVARAVFYAFAVYGPSGTGQADGAYWAAMRPYLLAWHRADPATAAERARGARVARYQATVSGAPAVNPFVEDSSLAARAFYAGR